MVFSLLSVSHSLNSAFTYSNFFLYLWSHLLICSMTLYDALEYSDQN